MKGKPPDLPVEAALCAPDVSNGVGDPAGVLNVCTDVHSVGDETESAVNETVNVRKRKTEAQTKDSLSTPEIETLEPTYQWKQVNVGNGGMYVPLDAPIQTASRTFAFGRLERAGQAIAPDIKGERAGNGGGDQDEGDSNGDGDDMESGGSADSQRVEGARLSTESQHTRQS